MANLDYKIEKLLSEIQSIETEQRTEDREDRFQYGENKKQKLNAEINFLLSLDYDSNY